MHRNMSIFPHVLAGRNALDIYTLAASLVGGISSGLLVRMQFTRIETSEVADLSLYKQHKLFYSFIIYITWGGTVYIFQKIM